MHKFMHVLIHMHAGKHAYACMMARIFCTCTDARTLRTPMNSCSNADKCVHVDSDCRGTFECRRAIARRVICFLVTANVIVICYFALAEFL